jgi:hypothetical protein
MICYVKLLPKASLFISNQMVSSIKHGNARIGRALAQPSNEPNVFLVSESQNGYIKGGVHSQTSNYLKK